MDASVAPVGFSAASRTAARTSAGISGRPDRMGGWSSSGRRVVGASAGSSRAVTSIPSRRRMGSSRVRAAIRARSGQLSRGRGVRRWSTASWWRRTRISISWWFRIGCATRSSSGAWRTRDRSAAAPSADHAGHRLAAKQQVNGCVHSFGHPQRHRSVPCRAGDPTCRSAKFTTMSANAAPKTARLSHTGTRCGSSAPSLRATGTTAPPRAVPAGKSTGTGRRRQGQLSHPPGHRGGAADRRMAAGNE